jgi:hypothetical protein
MKSTLDRCCQSLIGISFSFGKTRIVEDPNNPVVGRYSISDEQKQQAIEAAETFLVGGENPGTKSGYYK